MILEAAILYIPQRKAGIGYIGIGIGPGIGCALYADDGTTWKRGRNISQVSSCMQAAIKKVEQWTID